MNFLQAYSWVCKNVTCLDHVRLSQQVTYSGHIFNTNHDNKMFASVLLHQKIWKNKYSNGIGPNGRRAEQTVRMWPKMIIWLKLTRLKLQNLSPWTLTTPKISFLASPSSIKIEYFLKGMQFLPIRYRSQTTLVLKTKWLLLLPYTLTYA